MPVGEAWHTERGGMRIIMEKNSSNKFEISGEGKKRHIGEGADDGLMWLIAGRGMRKMLEKNSSNKFEISGEGKKRHIRVRSGWSLGVVDSGWGYAENVGKK